MVGTVVTFYSYKGGVGRSFALANVATLLGRWGFRVLCIDWDLEAPGLSHYFNSIEPHHSTERIVDEGVPGLVESFSDFQSNPASELIWNDRIILLHSKAIPGVSLLKAGREDDTYSKRLHELNWQELYGSGLGETLEELFTDLRQAYDFILIDSRTGMTDFTGITNSQLPDILAFLVASNDQSLTGTVSLVERAVAERNRLPLDRPRLFLLPIPSRFEAQLEHDLSAAWKKRFASELRVFYEAWTRPNTNYEKICQLTTIPYVPIWSFGERLAVVEDTLSDPLSVTYSLETIAALIAHRLDQTLLLLDSRDDYVSSARRLARGQEQSTYSVFLSYSHKDSEIAHRLSETLGQKGLSIFVPDPVEGDQSGPDLHEAIGRAAHLVVLLGSDEKFGRWQEREARTFLRQAASDEQARLLILTSVDDDHLAAVPPFLRQYNILQLSKNYDATVNDIVGLICASVTPKSGEESNLIVHVTTDGNDPIEGVSVCALAMNDTTVNEVTDSNGRSSLRLVPGNRYKLLVAHPKHASTIVKVQDGDRELPVRLSLTRNIGSVLVHSTGYIPGLNGRLNPILDRQDRRYLYADNVAINRGELQPVRFETNVPFELEDAQGTKFKATVKLISGRTALLDYQKLA